MSDILERIDAATNFEETIRAMKSNLGPQQAVAAHLGLPENITRTLRDRYFASEHELLLIDNAVTDNVGILPDVIDYALLLGNKRCFREGTLWLTGFTIDSSQHPTIQQNQGAEPIMWKEFNPNDYFPRDTPARMIGALVDIAQARGSERIYVIRAENHPCYENPSGVDKSDPVEMKKHQERMGRHFNWAAKRNDFGPGTLGGEKIYVRQLAEAPVRH
ncbi:MAG: hypothetical protein OXR66_03440 [Candidatus Woesearchaeota archaeon]|nr:hypothetical protein [Candidatus Woesearchaeota archaeon]